MAKLPDFLYHYTVGAKLPLIAKSGSLAPRRYSAAASPREKPILWWSENPTWDATANKPMSKDGGKTFFRPSLRELQQAVGIYRYRLDCRKPEALQAIGVKPIHWSRLPAVAHIAPNDVRDIVDRGLKFGATPTLWWGTLDLVPLSLAASGILALEVRHPVEAGQGQEQWAPASLEEEVVALSARNQRIAMTTPTLTPGARGV